MALVSVTITSQNCEPMFKKLDGIVVMQSRSGLSIKGEEQMVHTAVAGKDCPLPVPGVVVYVTADDVTGPKESLVTVRVNMESTNGPWHNTFSRMVLLLPAHAGDPAPPDNKVK